jgi:hypothetical protein
MSGDNPSVKEVGSDSARSTALDGGNRGCDWPSVMYDRGLAMVDLGPQRHEFAA